MNAADRPPSEEHSSLNPLDQALAEAFGERAQAKRSHPSVLQALQERTKSKLGVHIESQGLEDAPVRVTDEVKALRDPSGRYQVLGEIGRGGMGIVYKGRDQDLGRDVAMKVLKDEYAKRADVLARFVEEAQIGGQLQHPGIVPVYELGLQSGERPYFAMKLVKGETLAAQLARRSDPTQERRRLLGIFEQVCQTVAYAHARRVVHRDLKPANVMIGAFGEVQVVDWGFAKVLQRGALDEVAATKHVEQLSVIETVRSQADSGSHSVAGSMMGTPAYMPPEQALGDIARVDERSDVFSLGAILCELLTGDAPYREEDGDFVRQAANAQLDSAHERLGRCGADEALVNLGKECLAPSQRARPASAAEVAQRVSAYLTSVEERARQAQVRAAEARLKHRVTLMSAGAGVLVLALAAGGWMWLDGQARARRAEATQRVASAMSASSGARGRAQSARLDMSLWSTAVESAEQLVSLATSEDVDSAARSDAGELLAAVRSESDAAQAESDRLDRDKTMLAELELARIPADEDIRDTNRELRRLDAAYAKAFATYLDDVSLSEQPTELALASMRRGDIQVALAASLDDWALVRDSLGAQSDAPDATATARLRELAKELDGGDPWRNQLRALLPNAAHERTRLRELGDHADFTALTAVGCRVLGNALWAAGEQEAAIDVLRRGQELHPRDFDLCFQLALRLDSLDPPRRRESVDTYRIAQAIRPDHNEVIHRQLLQLFELGSHVDEERLVRILIARDPLTAHWQFHLGLALCRQGKTEEGIAAYRSSIEMDPTFAAPFNRLGVELNFRGEREEAVECLQLATELDPASSDAFSNLGWTLGEHGKLEEGIACLRRAIALDSRNAFAHGNLAGLLVKVGRLDEALASYRYVIDLAPSMAQAHRYLGNILAQQGKPEEAIASVRMALELDPNDVAAHYDLGVCLSALGRVEESIPSYRRAIELDPREARAHCNLGISLMIQGKLDEAIACYRKAIEVNPKLSNAYGSLANALRARGQVDEALECYRKAIELNPNDAMSHANLGLTLRSQGEPDEAIALLRRALELDPKCVTALNGLANALMNGQNDDEVFEYLQRGLELEPRNTPLRFNLGQYFVHKGELDRALQEFREAEQGFAGDPSDWSQHFLEVTRGLIEQTEQKIEQREAVNEVLEGRTAVSVAEWNAVVHFGHDQQRHREVVALAEATLRDAPELVGGPNGAYFPLCSAALLAASTDVDLTSHERSRLRELARTWLERAVDSWIAHAEENGPDAGDAHQMLEHVRDISDLASVRDTIDELPEAERAAWRALWERIADGATK